MKITFVLPCADLSGGVRVVAIYAERLKQRGHEVQVVSVAPQPPTFREQIRSLLKGKGWIRHQPKLPTHLDRADVAHRMVNHAPPLTDADIPDADVVVATWWETAEWVANLSPAKGVKAYFIQHHEVFDYLPQERARATYAMPLHKITISKWLVDLMRDEYGDREVSLVLNSVDTEQFHAPLRPKQPTPTVGLLYSPVPWKGCEVSLKALSIAAEQIPDLRLVAFGAGELDVDLPLPSNAQYIQQPEQHKIKDLYAQCDVWLCGSRSEGFHLPPLEAMACRCPVVSTAVGGPIDIIENGKNGYLVPINDAEALADRLVRVLSLSGSEWQAMSDAAHTTAVQYTWDDATVLFEAALQRAVDRYNRGDFTSASSLRVATSR